VSCSGSWPARRAPAPTWSATRPEQLIDATYTEFTSWIRAEASDQLTPQRAEVVAAVGLGALVASRSLAVLGMTTARRPDPREHLGRHDDRIDRPLPRVRVCQQTFVIVFATR
jgi:hypothetical protein